MSVYSNIQVNNMKIS